jgi:hypothetical protein
MTSPPGRGRCLWTAPSPGRRSCMAWSAVSASPPRPAPGRRSSWLSLHTGTHTSTKMSSGFTVIGEAWYLRQSYLKLADNVLHRRHSGPEASTGSRESPLQRSRRSSPATYPTSSSSTTSRARGTGGMAGPLRSSFPSAAAGARTSTSSRRGSPACRG